MITQVDDGEPRGAGVVPTSSTSMPIVVAVMLHTLDVHAGQKVLEIGTRTGYNAALLAHRLGIHNVTSVEIDAVIADAARDALNRFAVNANQQNVNLDLM